MERAVDYVILGAGIAGMTLRHVLGKDASAVLLDPSPGRYKIGESLIPQHFVEPEVRELFSIVRELPSATPKDGTLFVEDGSVGAFEPFKEAEFTLHVARQELEEATAKFFGTEIVRERVTSLDLDAREVKTETGTFHARRLVVDCSGPARIVARALGLAREVWPVWASWAYHDVLDADEERFWGPLRRKEKQFFRFSNQERRLYESSDFDNFRSTNCTVLTRVADGVWTWQIPLYRASRLSVGVVSRHGPIDADQYLDVARRSIGPQFRTALRPWDKSGPFNTFHVRNRFAWAADRFAGDSWALVGDAAFFGDPVYSVGTGFATNHAIQLGRMLREGGWSPARAAAHQRRTAELFERAKRAYDSWYFGKVVADESVAVEIQTNFLNGRAFQAQTIGAFTEACLVSHPQDSGNATSPKHGEPVADRIAAMLEEDGLLVGWRLERAVAFRARIELHWERPDAAALVLVVEPTTPGRKAFRTIADLGLSYRPPATGASALDGQSLALLEAFGHVVERERDGLRTMMDDASA